MNKILLRSASLMLAIVLAFGTFVPGRATSQITALMPDRTVNLAFFYKPPTNSDAVTVAGFGSVILTGGDEIFRDQLVANGFNSNIIQYYRAEAIQDPGDCTSSPWKNQIAFKAGDFCNISANHPDWFLLDTNGNRIRIGSGNYYRMDPGNAGWRNFFVTRLIEIQQLKGWSGVFLDNLEAGVNQIQLDGVTAARYPDNASYRPAVRGFVQYLYQNYAVPYNRPLMANIIARSTTDEAIWLDYMQHLNGAMQERWAVDWDYTDYLSEANWKADMALAEKTQAQGKYIILVAPGEKTDTNRQKFAFASYLLISNGKAAFRYSNSSIYREVWSYDNYTVQLGAPRGTRYQTGTAWRRDFANGYVIVDPINHTATISTTPPATVTNTPTRLNTNTATFVPTLAATSTPTDNPTSTATATQVLTSTATSMPTLAATQTTVNTPTAIPPSTATATQVHTNTSTSMPTLAATQTTVSTPTAIPSLTAAPATKTPTAGPLPAGAMYDQKNSAFSYSAGWTEVPEASAYEGSYRMTKKSGASVTFTFTGQSFSIIYRSGPGYGKMQVYLDGKQVAMLNQNTASYVAQNKWKYTGTMAVSKHTIKLVSISRDGVKTTLDAISIR